jgi:hypothetical protein
MPTELHRCAVVDSLSFIGVSQLCTALEAVVVTSFEIKIVNELLAVSLLPHAVP